jgi:hypothetical protein
MYNMTKKDKGLGIARGLADSGAHGSWRSVETRMHQLGHYEADLWFADLLFRNEIEAICVRTCRA